MPGMNTATASRPFLPSDIDHRHAIARACTAHALAALSHGDAATIARQHWPRDRGALGIIQRAVAEPASMSGSTWGADLAPDATAAFFAGLAPQSAAAKLIASGVQVSLAGRGRVSVPFLATPPEP